MANTTVTFKYEKFTAPITNSKRSAIGKRGITGGVEVLMAEIPNSVLGELLMGAIEDFVQVGLKTLDKDNCTREQCQAAMQARLDLLKSGALSNPSGGRKAPVRDVIKAAAKALLKKAIQDRSEEKLDGKVLLATVNELFKQHAVWAKKTTSADDKAKLAPIAQLVEDALTQAREAQAKQDELSKSLTSIVAQAKKASAAKAAAAEAEVDDEVDAEAAPAPAPKPRPTPTQGVASRKKGQTGRSA